MVWYKKKLNIFSKLVLTFLLMIVPIYALSLILNYISTNDIKNHISETTASHVHSYFDSFQTDIDRILKLKKEFLDDNDLLDLSTVSHDMTNFDKRNAILQLQKRLQLLESSSIYITNVKAAIPLMNRTIYDSYYDGSIAEDEYAALANGWDAQGGYIQNWENRILLSQPSLVLTDKKQPAFLLEIELSKDALKNALRQIMEESDAILFSGDQWQIDSGGDSLITAHLKEFVVKRMSTGAENGQFTVDFNRKKYHLFYEHSQELGTTLLVYILENNVYSSLYKYRIWFWFLSIISLVIVFVSSYWIYRNIHEPLYSMVHAFRKVEKGDLNHTLEHKNRDEFHYLYMQYNAMLSKLKELIFEISEQKILSQRAELKQLQSQINPHFLYNSFFVLYRMAQLYDIENVIKFSEYLGTYFKFITRTSADEVTLEEEVDHARAYAEIQTIRFSNRIETIFAECPDGCRGIMVPRLILQPIIENAFKYALEVKLKDGKMRISFMEHTDFLKISVEDNGDLLRKDEIEQMNIPLQTFENVKETVGLFNVHRRLQLKFGKATGLFFSQSSLGGLKVEITIPIARE